MVSIRDISTKNLSEYDSVSGPSNPNLGTTVFARRRGRKMLSQVGPQGMDSYLQPAVFSNKIARLNAINNLNTMTSESIVPVSGGLTAISNSTSNFFSSIVKAAIRTGTTANTNNYLKSTTPQWFLSNTPNMGGFHFVAKFGIITTSNTNRFFLGFSTSAAALSLSSTEPSSFTSILGIGCDSTDANLSFMINDANGTATKVPLGSNFPAQTAGTYYFEISMFVPSGNGSTIYWCVRRLNDGVFVEGINNTDLPAINAVMNFHLVVGNAASASDFSFGLTSVYIETDN